jgi:hypothetical protein
MSELKQKIQKFKSAKATQQLRDLFLSDPETGESLFIASDITNNADGSNSFEVRSTSGSRWLHTFRTEELPPLTELQQFQNLMRALQPTDEELIEEVEAMTDEEVSAYLKEHGIDVEPKMAGLSERLAQAREELRKQVGVEGQ